MKKNFIFILFIGSWLCIGGCQKENKPTLPSNTNCTVQTKPDSSIIETWYLVSQEYKGDSEIYGCPPKNQNLILYGPYPILPDTFIFRKDSSVLFHFDNSNNGISNVVSNGIAKYQLAGNKLFMRNIKANFSDTKGIPTPLSNDTVIYFFNVLGSNVNLKGPEFWIWDGDCSNVYNRMHYEGSYKKVDKQ